MDDFDERVRHRAYRLWVEEGCPEGRSEAHWDKARELVKIEESKKAAAKPVPRPEEARARPAEPTATVGNGRQSPTSRDQGEQASSKPASAAAARAPAKAKPGMAPKEPKNPATKRR